MRRLISAAALAATMPLALTAPAVAQTAADQARWEDALQRYREETQRYYQAWDRYQAARRANPQNEREEEAPPAAPADQPYAPPPAPAPEDRPEERAAPPPDERYAPPPSSYEEVPQPGPAAPPAGEPAAPEAELPPLPPVPAAPVPLPQAPEPPVATPAAPQSPPPPPAAGEATDIAPLDHDERFGAGYDAARFYRDAAEYQERTLKPQERIYRGSDNRFYCQRSDGTAGLVTGAFGGDRLAGIIDPGRSRTVGAVLGATSNGLAGAEAEQQDRQMRCR